MFRYLLGERAKQRDQRIVLNMFTKVGKFVLRLHISRRFRVTV